MTDAVHNARSSLARRYNLGESEEWQNLIRHFELAGAGFNFIVLLVPDSDGAEICRRALQEYLDQHDMKLRFVPLEAPESLKTLADALLAPKLREEADAIWVSATSHETLGETEQWKSAWREGAALLNQVRNELRRRISGTLIFAGAPWLQEILRGMAPDLWSVRALTINLSPQPIDATPISLLEDVAASDPELALQEAKTLRGQPGKELALARMLHRAGEGRINQERWREAASLFEEAVGLKKRFHDDAENIGVTLLDWGMCLNMLERNTEAIHVLQEALAHFQHARLRQYKAKTLNRLGVAKLDLGQFREAIEYFNRSLFYARLVGDLRVTGKALSNSAAAHAVLGETPQAIRYAEMALSVLREIGDRRGEGNTILNLGLAYAAGGEIRKALESYELALSIAREVGDRRGEGRALGNLGILHAAMGETRRAIELYEQSLNIVREIGDRHGEGNALMYLGLALAKLGERERAIECAEAALTIYEEIEWPFASKVRAQLTEWRK